jgi:hypothetical protein
LGKSLCETPESVGEKMPGSLREKPRAEKASESFEDFREAQVTLIPCFLYLGCD